jgi:hypothetical protein
MAKVEEFGIIPVARGLNDQLLVQKEIILAGEEEALRGGKIFADVLGGAVAFKRVNDPEEEIVGQGVIIGRYGVMAPIDGVGYDHQ